MAAWEVIALVGAATVLLKSAGPLLFAHRELSGRTTAVVDLVGPVLLTALVVTAVFVSPGRLVLDARAAGLAAAVLAVVLRAPLLVVVAAAAATTAIVRALT